MEMSLANPFASLRMHGGSNHLIMPTSLLQQAATVDEELGGGVVRVESCTSDFINALYPGESTANLSPRLRVMLTQSGHIGRQFAPSVRNALGEYAHRLVSSLLRWESTAMPANECSILMVSFHKQAQRFANSCHQTTRSYRTPPRRWNCAGFYGRHVTKTKPSRSNIRCASFLLSLVGQTSPFIVRSKLRHLS